MSYAQEVRDILKKEKIFVDIDTSGNTLPKKVRSAQLAQYNFIFGKHFVPLELLKLSSLSQREY